MSVERGAWSVVVYPNTGMRGVAGAKQDRVGFGGGGGGGKERGRGVCARGAGCTVHQSTDACAPLSTLYRYIVYRAGIYLVGSE